MGVNETPDLRQSFVGSDLDHPVDLSNWQRVETGGSSLALPSSGLRLLSTDAAADRYANAQIDDYEDRSRHDFLWRPPLTLAVRARFSHPASQCRGDSGLLGTSGFGFWNDPFLMTGRRAPTLPRAIWFFYASPPSDIVLGPGTPGFGWKAMTLDALHPAAGLLALTAPLAVPLMNISAIYRTFWPAAQRILRISEAMVASEMTDWHTYRIDWRSDQARFDVDNQRIMDVDSPPRGPLGLVIWLDNQYLVVTPWGRLRRGFLAVPGAQWLELGSVQIDR
jgi:hypothetical protein